MNQQDKRLLEWRAIRHMEDLFEQGMFSNLKLDNQSQELNGMFHSCFKSRQTVEQEAVKDYIKSVIKASCVDEVCGYVPKTIDLSLEKYNSVFNMGSLKQGFLVRDGEAFASFSCKAIARNLTVEYYQRKFLQENGYEVVILYLQGDDFIYADNLGEEMYNHLVKEKVGNDDLRNMFFNLAVDLACELNELDKPTNSKMIECCLEVESKYNKDMNVFYQKYMDLASMHSSLIVPNKEKVKQYLKEIKLV